MGYELRAVPRDWVHPEGKALYAGHEYRPWLERWELNKAKWDDGLIESPDGSGWDIRSRADCDIDTTFEEWFGEKPDPANYMPDWLPEDAPCLQWYEAVSEGTPISPVFETEAEAEMWHKKEFPGPGEKEINLGLDEFGEPW